MDTTYYSLASKGNFNKSLNHFFAVNDIVDKVESDKNLADIIDAQLDSEEISHDQVLPIVGAVIKDKYNYSFNSYNIQATVTEFDKIIEETTKWTAIDIIIVYYNPNGEIFLINPKNPAHWIKARELTRDQLAVIYARHLKEKGNRKLEKEAITAIEEMIAGKDVFINQEFIDSTKVAKKIIVKETRQAAATAAAPAVTAAAPAAPAIVTSGKKQSTPKYSVLVTNELFHNGNVEAWKKIVESFKISYPDLEVLIFYDGELINDINALFKWGKVKNGKFILFQVSGENIRGVSKLQKYLFEGASPRFEQFLKLGVGKVLKLF